jgi:hypothetical protein
VSHTWSPAPDHINFWNYYLEIKYFDDSGTLQVVYQDYAAVLDGTEAQFDEGLTERANAYLSGEGFLATGSGDEILSPSRIYSVTQHKEYRSYDITPTP